MLRHLRREAGVGIKQLGPELGVSYTYVSKVESNHKRPSADFIARVSEYFEADVDRLMLAAERIPPDVMEILREHPDDAITFLRDRFGRRDDTERSARRPPVDR